MRNARETIQIHGKLMENPLKPIEILQFYMILAGNLMKFSGSRSTRSSSWRMR